MRFALRVLLGASLLIGLPSTARAQEQSPLEDVVLQGRVLQADGSPVANHTVYVDARRSAGATFFSFFAFVFTAGTSLIDCIGEPGELCPIANSKRFTSTTDANGHYSFTFKDAHRRGEQTDTDYLFGIKVNSQRNADRATVASYELELQDPVHNAPDVVVWDPAVKLAARARGYEVVYEPRRSSKNNLQVLLGDRQAPIDVLQDRTIDARGVEDNIFSAVPNASKDESAAGTIYHQRFSAAPVTRQGALVPLSRGAACTAVRKDGSRIACGMTDGDLITPGVPDNDISTDEVPVTELTIDMGAAKKVGEVRSRCSCPITGSADGVAWRNLPQTGRIGSPQSLRYIRATGTSLGGVPEVSVWGPTNEEAITPLDTTTTVAGDSPQAAPATPDGGSPLPWILLGVTLLLLGGVGGYAFSLRRRTE